MAGVAVLALLVGLLWNSHKISRWFHDDLDATIANMPAGLRRGLESPWPGRALAVAVCVAAVLGFASRLMI